GLESKEPKATIGDEIPYSADDVIAAKMGLETGTPGLTRLEQAKQCILGFLEVGDGEARISDVYEATAKQGISEATVLRAKKDLNLVREGNKWTWGGEVADV